jgi:hypothetical protein
VHGKSKLTETENGETDEEQSQEHVHNFLSHKEFVMTDQTINSAYHCFVLQGLRENV